MNLADRDWMEFIVGELFDEINNSKAYHKTQVTETTVDEKFIPYISRTQFNNGLELLVEDDEDFIKNPGNTIVFGAESATFFYEPFDYITGNKMYYIKDSHFNRYVCLFLVALLNKNIGEHFGYSHGLTATRLKQQKIILPVNDEGEPDYKFMEDYVKEEYKNQSNNLLDLINLKLNKLEYVELPGLSELCWGSFFIESIGEIKSGKDITKKNMVPGDTPYISSTSLNNGVSAFVGNTNNTLESNCISINRNGSVGYSFYHPYPALFSNDCRKLITGLDKYTNLFIVNQIKAQKDKYNYGYKMGTNRIKRQKILLPVDERGDIDYEYMRQYMINMEINMLQKYMDYINK